MYGRSTSNQVEINIRMKVIIHFQRIEAWWGQLCKNAAGWWMDYFKVFVTCCCNSQNSKTLIPKTSVNRSCMQEQLLQESIIKNFDIQSR